MRKLMYLRLHNQINSVSNTKQNSHINQDSVATVPNTCHERGILIKLAIITAYNTRYDLPVYVKYAIAATISSIKMISSDVQASARKSSLMCCVRKAGSTTKSCLRTTTLKLLRSLVGA